MESEARVERSLPSEGKKHSVRTLFSDDTLQEIFLKRQKIHFVRKVLGGLVSGDVGIDQNHLHLFFFERFDGLAAAVVELACFAYLKRARSQNQNFSKFGFHACLTPSLLLPLR